MRGLRLFAAAMFTPTVTYADTPTPLNAPLAPGATTLIACAPGADMDTGSDVVRETYHYRLHLPHDYDGHGRRYPVMFLAAPGGDATMGTLADRLIEDRWLVAMLVESKNGTADWLPNFTCAYDDVMARVRAQPGLMFCSGLSGAARVCSAYPALRPGFRGMILQSAGPWGGRGFLTPGNEDMVIHGTFGTLDFNFHHAKRMRLFLPDRVAVMIEIFDGGHEWAPPPVIGRALDWILQKALVARPFESDLGDGYRWYFANRLAAYEKAASEIERYVMYREIQALPTQWSLDLGESERAKLARMATASERFAASKRFVREYAAWAAWSEARTRDENSRGRDLEEVAAAYEGAAAAHSGTVYGTLAAQRYRAVRWETGVYP